MRRHLLGMVLLGLGCAGPLYQGVLEVTTEKDTKITTTHYRTVFRPNDGGSILWVATATDNDPTTALLSLQVSGRTLPARCRELTLSADGQELPLGVTQLRSDLANTKLGKFSVNSEEELRTAALSAESVSKLASASKINGVLCGVSYSFSDEQRQTLAKFAAQGGFTGAPASGAALP